MAWSKGAVVIVKRGDQDWADSIEQAISIRKASEREVEELKRHKNLTKIHDDKFTDIAIENLRNRYRVKPVTRVMDILLSPWTLLLYGVVVLSERWVRKR